MYRIILFLFLLTTVISAFENPLNNANFSQGLTGWYTETKGQIEIIEGTSGTKALKMTRTEDNKSNPFIAQWIKWPIGQKYTMGMRYKAKLNEKGVILLSCEGYKYIDSLYLYTDTIDTKDQWVIQELDTKLTEFIEGSGQFTVQFRGDTYGTFIIDEIFW